MEPSCTHCVWVFKILSLRSFQIFKRCQQPTGSCSSWTWRVTLSSWRSASPQLRSPVLSDLFICQVSCVKPERSLGKMIYFSKQSSSELSNNWTHWSDTCSCFISKPHTLSFPLQVSTGIIWSVSVKDNCVNNVIEPRRLVTHLSAFLQSSVSGISIFLIKRPFKSLSGWKVYGWFPHNFVSVVARWHWHICVAMSPTWSVWQEAIRRAWWQMQYWFIEPPDQRWTFKQDLVCTGRPVMFACFWMHVDVTLVSSQLEWNTWMLWFITPGNLTCFVYLLLFQFFPIFQEATGFHMIIKSFGRHETCVHPLGNGSLWWKTQTCKTLQADGKPELLGRKKK